MVFRRGATCRGRAPSASPRLRRADGSRNRPDVPGRLLTYTAEAGSPSEAALPVLAEAVASGLV